MKMADERKFELEIITPERVFYKGEAVMVEFNTTEGEIGVLKKHIPMTVIVKPGILTITEEDDNIKEAALHEGFVQITFQVIRPGGHGQQQTCIAHVAFQFGGLHGKFAK